MGRLLLAWGGSVSRRRNCFCWPVCASSSCGRLRAQAACAFSRMARRVRTLADKLTVKTASQSVLD